MEVEKTEHPSALGGILRMPRAQYATPYEHRKSLPGNAKRLPRDPKGTRDQDDLASEEPTSRAAFPAFKRARGAFFPKGKT